MASKTTVNLSESASGDANIIMIPSPIVPSTDRASESPMTVPDLSSIDSLTAKTSKKLDVTADMNPVVPSVDACDVPLPDEGCDWDLLEISPLDNHEGNTPGSEVVHIANNDPTVGGTINRAGDDSIPDNDDSNDISFAVSSSAPTTPQTPKSTDESLPESRDDHGSSTSPLSSIDSSPKTPAKEGSSSDPFILEDSTKGLSLDNLDLTSPNWMGNIAQFLEKLGDLETEREETQKELKSGDNAVDEEEGGYREPVIALPDTPDYHPFANNFQIRLSKYGGFGTFATRDLKIGEVILIEKPLLRTSRDDFYNNFLKLSDEDQATFLKLYTPPGEYSSLDGRDHSRIRAIVAANSFAINPYGNNIICVYNVASRLNHACQPVANVRFDFGYQFDANAENADVIKMIISRKMKAGSELFISYGGSPMSLYERYGFRCCCGGCEGVSDVDLAIKKKREMIAWKN